MKNPLVEIFPDAEIMLLLIVPVTLATLVAELNVNPADGKSRVASPTIKGTAAYQAGIDMGDFILKIGDVDLKGNLDDILRKYKPGERIPVTFEHKGKIKTAILDLRENNTLALLEFEKASAEQIRFKNNWLSSKIK